jgi:hypothetical protein
MSTPAVNLAPIFATPFATVSLAGSEGFNPPLLSLFTERAQASFRDPALPQLPFCFRSREELFEWDAEAVTRLREEMLGALCSVVMAASLYTEAEFNALALQARARFIIVRPDGCIPAATVPLASWCALYCVAAPPPSPTRLDSAALRLYEARLTTMFMDAANSRLRRPFGAAHHLWRPVAGEMAAFPAALAHEVALNRSDKDLVLVAVRARFAAPAQGAMPPW